MCIRDSSSLRTSSLRPLHALRRWGNFVARSPRWAASSAGSPASRARAPTSRATPTRSSRTAAT
eukprot:14680944-Alexandrium_andersonii.AAC.1